MKKRLTAGVLSLAMVISLLTFTGCSGRRNTTEDDGTHITRGQWIAMLAEAFGLDTYQETAPYYTDIGSDHELFIPVQAASEWGILSIYQGDTLNAGRPVTRGEAASTAAIAAGFRPEASSFNEKGQFIGGPSIDYAIAHSIVEDKSLSGTMTAEECEAAIAQAKDVYLNGAGAETVSVIYNEDVIDLNQVAPDFIEAAEGSVTFSSAVAGGISLDSAGTPTASIQTGDGTAEIRVGDVFVALPMEGQWAGAAYKVVSMEEHDGSITFVTEAPTLGDLYDELVLHTTLSLEDGFITWADGVTVSPAAPNDLSQSGQTGTYHIELLPTYWEERPVTADYLSGRTIGTDSFRYQDEWPISIRSGVVKLLYGDTSGLDKLSGALQKLSRSGFIYDGTPSISDFIQPTESWTKKLTKQKKFEPGGYQIDGTISLALEVTPDIEYHKWSVLGLEAAWPESASLTVKSDIAADLTVVGSLTGEYELGFISIPTAIAGLTIDGTLSIVGDLNGSAQVKMGFQNTNRIDWQAPLNFRQTSRQDDSKADVEALMDLTVGPNVSVSASAFSVGIIGMDLQLALEASASSAVEGECQEYIQDGTTMRDYTEWLHFQTDLYVPIISLTASGPDFLADTMGLEKTWELLGKEKTFHFTPIDEKDLLWQTTVALNENGEIIDPAEKLLADLQSGDFSAFAGTYTAFAEYNQNYGLSSSPDFILHEDGSITGGGLTWPWDDEPLEYSGTPPTSVVRGSDGGWGKGTFQCFVANRNQGYQSEYFIIYPPGTLGYNDTTCISYIFADGGIIDIRYTKID